MGKQINFYMSDKIQASFIEYLEQTQFVFLNYNAQIVEQPFSANVFVYLATIKSFRFKPNSPFSIVKFIFMIEPYCL